MSDTTTAPPTPPGPTPMSLTGATATVHAHLAALDEPITATELALATKTGHSTTGKALSTLEKLGLAIRTPGGFNGRHRTPDLWRPTPTAEEPDPTASPETPSSAQPDGVAIPQEPVADAPADESEPAPYPSSPKPQVPTAGTDRTNDATRDTRPPDTTPNNDHSDADQTTGILHSETANATHGQTPADEAAVSPQRPAPQQHATPPTLPQSATNGRLAPGALRQMVSDHLQAHPDEAFTATKISRVIEKSSGAIANALVTLTKQGFAEKVDEKPLRYRLATPLANPQ